MNTCYTYVNIYVCFCLYLWWSYLSFSTYTYTIFYSFSTHASLHAQQTIDIIDHTLSSSFYICRRPTSASLSEHGISALLDYTTRTTRRTHENVRTCKHACIYAPPACSALPHDLSGHLQIDQRVKLHHRDGEGVLLLRSPALSPRGQAVVGVH